MTKLHGNPKLQFSNSTVWHNSVRAGTDSLKQQFGLAASRLELLWDLELSFVFPAAVMNQMRGFLWRFLRENQWRECAFERQRATFASRLLRFEHNLQHVIGVRRRHQRPGAVTDALDEMVQAVRPRPVRRRLFEHLPRTDRVLP